MSTGEPIPADDLIVARMIITDIRRQSRTQAAFLLLGTAALVSAVVYGFVTGEWQWFPMGTLTLVIISAALRVRAQRLALTWQRRYLDDAAAR